MKNFYLFFFAVLCINSATAQFQQIEKTSGKSLPSSDEWFSKAQQQLRVREYSFKNNPSLTDGFYGASTTQKIGFLVEHSGYSISPVLYEQYPAANVWKQTFELLNINKGMAAYTPKADSKAAASGYELMYDYKDFSIQYLNGENGLRQNFIINRQPAGSEKLKIEIQLAGTLKGQVMNNELCLRDETGNVKLFYRSLKVWDADHRELMAKMELKEDVLSIIVDDKNARYPVTVDPLNQSAIWASSANGILPNLLGQQSIDAAYGFSSCGLGDVNNDGYDDVAIGAPATVDIISGTGTLAAVGAVFVFYGSALGLPATPSAVLQPTTAVAGALFGYSIAGGDINNDGKNDILVGAPLDNVTISTGGSGTATSKVGKVYAFDGATLGTTTTPFLNVHLSGSGILENGLNLSVNALFGFSVAITEDMNADGKKDILVGAPVYAGIKYNLFGTPSLDVKSGGAFLFLTNASNNNLTIKKLEPIKTSLLGLGLLQANFNGLLFGYSVDGLGDYNGDGKPDIVVGAPAGIDVSSISVLLNSKLLQGSAIVYYGNGNGVNQNPGTTLVATSGGLLTNLSGTIANVANLFGTSVKGIKSVNKVRTGSVMVGAPLGGVLANLLGLNVKAGTVNVFLKKTSSPAASVVPDQVISSPRNDNNILQLIQANILFGFSLDNIYDVNCDGFQDIVVGEPASSGLQLLNANVGGGAAYVFLGVSGGLYKSAPSWTLLATTDAFLGVNATSLIGFSVAGAGNVYGPFIPPHVLVSSPSRSLDFGSGLLNLGNTFGTLFGLVAGDNGIGKSYLFATNLCFTLPVKAVELKATYVNGISKLNWKTIQETNCNRFEVERSTDGIHYKYLGQVAAKGNSNVNSFYDYNDMYPSTGNNYYRLKIVDNNGNMQYSNIVLLNVVIKENSINVYPNPFVQKLNIQVVSSSDEEVIVKVYDVTGKELMNKKQLVKKGINMITMDGLTSLSAGQYIVKVESLSGISSRKIMKL